MTFDTLIANGRIVTEDGVYEADIGILGGRLEAFLGSNSRSRVSAKETFDASDLHVFPGLVDPHAHIGVGGEDDWATETEAAVRGGVTTVLNYVIGSSSYLELCAAELERAGSRSYIDFGFHVVPCTTQHLEELASYVRELGITSFKHFMSFRGDEGAYLGVVGTDDGYLLEYLRRVAENAGAIANVHAENIEVSWKLRDAVQAAGLDGLAAWDASRPDYIEAEAVYRAAFYAREAGAPLYVVHVSSARSLEEIELIRSKPGGPPFYVETCTHYLTHTADSTVGTLGKVNPPLRHADDCDALWRAIADGKIQTIGSDHVGRNRKLKETDIWTATAGIPGIGCTLTVLLSEGVHKRGLPLPRVSALAATNAARIFGLYPRKGTLAIGSDADLVLVDLDEERRVTSNTWPGNAGFNLYDGWSLKGWPLATMLRGRFVYQRGQITVERGCGMYLER